VSLLEIRMCGVEVVFERFVALVLASRAAMDGSLPSVWGAAGFSTSDVFAFAAIGIGLVNAEVELPDSSVTALSLRLYSAGPGIVYSNGL